MNDSIRKPKHYQFSKACFEVRDVINECVNRVLDENKPANSYNNHDIIYDYTNSIKYLLRAFSKYNEIEDLKKARYCIDNMIFEMEKNNESR